MIPVIVRFVELLFNIMTFAILARVLLSWFPTAPNNRLITILYDITDPILGPIRRMIPPVGMLDLSPIIAIVLLQVLEYIILSGVPAY